MVNLSNDWFSPKERIIFTTLANMMAFGGGLGGFLMPNLFID